MIPNFLGYPTHVVILNLKKHSFGKLSFLIIQKFVRVTTKFELFDIEIMALNVYWWMSSTTLESSQLECGKVRAVERVGVELEFEPK